MISPALTEIHRRCHTSYWRGLDQGTERPVRWIMLSYDEALELSTTGSFTIPLDLIPEAVVEWRKLLDGAEEVAKVGTLGILDETGAMVEEIGKVAVRG